MRSETGFPDHLFPCLSLITMFILSSCCPEFLSPVMANDTIPMSVPRNGSTRSPFHPTFAPGAASTPVVPESGIPVLVRKNSTSSSTLSSTSTKPLGSRFLSFLRSVRGTLEDVVSGVDPGVNRVFYQEKGVTTSGASGERIAEIIVRKSSILTGGGSRIIGCRIFSESSVISEKLSGSKESERRLISRKEFANLVKNCADIDRMKPYMIPTLKTEQQLLSSVGPKNTEDSNSNNNSSHNETTSDSKNSNGNNNNTSAKESDTTGGKSSSKKGLIASSSKMSGRRSEAPGGEEEKNGVFDGVAIFPGTKWCGAGDIAASDEDLGHEREADSCCRAHDKCPDAIPAGETKYNLTNTASYTKSACTCDREFYECLQSAATFVGDQVGRLYFNVLQIQCFKHDYPIVKCLDQKGFLLNKVRSSCQEYELDETKERVTQFFDPSYYTGQHGPLFNIPVVSGFLQKPVTHFKESTINGGLIGNVVAG